MDETEDQSVSERSTETKKIHTETNLTEPTTNGTTPHLNGHEVSEESNGEIKTNGDHVDQTEIPEQDEFMNKMKELTLEKEQKNPPIISLGTDKEIVSKPEESITAPSEPAIETMISQSKSSEFTYTTFGSVERTESGSDEQLQVSNEVKVELSELVAEEVSGEAPAAAAETVPVVAESSGDVNLVIDEFITQVKLDKLSNKDVCDYMLNLLVSGEFDLEKNFIIQNVKSILHLVQVIKCAKPSLKVSCVNNFIMR